MPPKSYDDIALDRPAAKSYDDITLGGGGEPARITVRPPQETPPASIVGYPGHYTQMRQEAQNQVGRGIEQLGNVVTSPGGGNSDLASAIEGIQHGRDIDYAVQQAQPADGPTPGAELAKGAGNVAGGAAGYVFSPLGAAIRSILSAPLEQRTGIPKEYTEFAATLALPMPKKLPPVVKPASESRVNVPATEELFNSADKGYEAARASKVEFHPTFTKQLKDEITAELKAEGYRDFTAAKTFRALEELKTLESSNVSDIDAVRKVLNRAGADPSERDAVRRAVTLIDKKLTPMVPEIAQARGDYAAASRAETIQDLMDSARLSAGSTHSGQNFDNAVRQKFRSILNSDKKSRGFSEDELAQMERIVMGTRSGDAARFLGNLGGGGGGIGAFATGAYTHGVAPALAFGLKKIANSITTNEVAKLDAMVRSRSPAARKVGAPLEDWSMAAQAAEVAPSPRNIARLTLASRNLSTNLADVGIKVAPDSLIRLHSPVGAGAEGNQQDVPGIPAQE